MSYKVSSKLLLLEGFIFLSFQHDMISSKSLLGPTPLLWKLQKKYRQGWKKVSPAYSVYPFGICSPEL